MVTDLSLEDLEREARHVIGEMAYAYYAGGADDERLLTGNVEAWGRWQLHPRVLAGMSEVSTATTVLGSAVASPVGIAPTAIQGLAHPEGEVATARGAAAAGRAADPFVAGDVPPGGRGGGGAGRGALDADLCAAGPGPHGRPGGKDGGCTATGRWC